MTRINVGVEPWELPSRLLLAECREITRIPNAVKSGRANIWDVPEIFSLGTGHVRFFYNKIGFLKSRYEGLYRECCRRGFNVVDKQTAFLFQFTDVLYVPTARDRMLIIERIESKGFKLNERSKG